MKGSLMGKFMYLFCALAGCLAGYGIFTLTNAELAKPNTITKDNTLVREAENSVFFDTEQQEEKNSVSTEGPIVTEKPVLTADPKQDDVPVATPVPETVTSPVAMPPEPTEIPRDKQESSDMMPSLASQWASTGLVVIPTPFPAISSSVEMEPSQTSVVEAITYPAKIFGQTPVINRSDTYVSYFEFAYDLIAMMEPEVQQRGLNMNSLLAKFVIKALFCGVDIEKLDINAPIPRRLAALCLWLAAQVLNESGCDTTARSAQQYVTDIAGCSSSEKKAVAYLYEQGILKGYQTAGQKFYPDAGLTTESGTTWLSRVKQCWK